MEERNWIQWKIYFWRCELIYFLGGTPDEHKNTLHYRNIKSVVGDLKRKIHE